jgi:PAS domain S-box-containing protein
VTSRIAIEQRMQKSIDRFNIVSKATSDAIWDYDLMTDQVVWNDVAKSVFGFKETIQTAKWWQNHVHPDDLDRVNAAIAKLAEHKDNRLELEYRFRCEDGGYKHILDRSFVLFDETGKLKRVIGSMQDMTERVKYVQHVEAQNEHLKNVAWTQSHVVRAPLSRIMGIADLLSSSAKEDNTDAELIRHLASSAAELDSVIRELVKKTEAIYKGEDQ